MAGAAAGGRGGGPWGPGRGGAGGLRRGCSPPAPAGSPRAGLQPLRATVPFQLQQPHQRRDGGGRAGEPGLERVPGGGVVGGGRARDGRGRGTGRSLRGKRMGARGEKGGRAKSVRAEGARARSGERWGPPLGQSVQGVGAVRDMADGGWLWGRNRKVGRGVAWG